MLCPHCSSPRHNLCAPGFRLEVDMTTLGDALADFTAASLKTHHHHLLGHDTGAAGLAQKDDNNPPEARADTSILVVLPFFADAGLGTYGAALVAARAPQLLPLGQLELPGFRGLYGQIHLLDLSSDKEPQARRMNILLIGQGNRSDCNEKGFCGLVGSALDSGLSGQYDQIVIAISDFTGAPIKGQAIGAIARCRLAVAINEEKADQVVRRMTLILHPEQVPSICRGIEVPGPLCFSCEHPRAGLLSLSCK